jgi:hypothetical protein
MPPFPGWRICLQIPINQDTFSDLREEPVNYRETLTFTESTPDDSAVLLSCSMVSSEAFVAFCFQQEVTCLAVQKSLENLQIFFKRFLKESSKRHALPVRAGMGLEGGSSETAN